MSWQFDYRNQKKLPVEIIPTGVIPEDLHGVESACTVGPTLSTFQNSLWVLLAELTFTCFL